MLIVEDSTEIKLMQTLERLREREASIRCVELLFSKLGPEYRPERQKLVELVHHVFEQESGSAQLYFLADGDVVIFLANLQAKQLRQFRMHLPLGSEDYLKLHEFSHQLNAVIIRVQEKIDAARARAEAENQRLIEAMHARKRNSILAFTPDDIDIPRIKSARQKRTQREIMIIEDDPFSRKLLENILPKTHRITATGEPDQALARYVLSVPDVLFLDINLPDVNGHELLDKILSIDPQAYIIMISGNSDRENVVRAMSRGARGFIAKPFARERVREYLERCPTISSELPHAHS